MLPIAVDAMGGDNAPKEIVEGALLAVEELGLPVVLVGQPEAIGDAGGLDIIPASEVIGMRDDPAQGVRRKKDSSLVRAAEAVRDGKAAAMVSAGNTGATMGAALLRMGRLKGVQRPAIATPIPVPGQTPTVLLDAGANAECTPAYLLQFAQMGAAFASARYRIKEPKVALLSIGEEETKGTSLVKEAHALLAGSGLRFVGNVEGRDIMSDAADVVVTDGFTGNVALKTLEGSLKFLVSAVFAAMNSTDEVKSVSHLLLDALAPVAAELDPDATGGAMLLGVEGVCIISHGSSSPRAIVNAVRVAGEMVDGGLVDRLRGAVAVT
ncbi:MAG TPA: phosphate acyltransferase PlsX [Acidimicrobiales bacterium]|jgi:glycerol-3-phosphate acyltransferase PlsX|nr:phosphate acyltransferase PlsX [Acidimicrobiales bacterium]